MGKDSTKSYAQKNIDNDSTVIDSVISNGKIKALVELGPRYYKQYSKKFFFDSLNSVANAHRKTTIFLKSE